MHGISDGGLVRDRRSGRVRDIRVGVGRGAGRPRRGLSGTPRLVLEVLLWLVGRYSEQGVLLHVCSKAFQRRPFRMTSSEVGARRARRAVGGAWRDSATMCYSGPGAGRSGGALPGPVALRALEVASYRRSRGQGQGAPRTCRCIETLVGRSPSSPRGQGAPRSTCRRIEHFLPEGFWGGLGVAVSSSWSSIGSRGVGFEGSIEIGNGPGSAPRGRPCGVAVADAVVKAGAIGIGCAVRGRSGRCCTFDRDPPSKDPRNHAETP